jgi:hypothetical protein
VGKIGVASVQNAQQPATRMASIGVPVTLLAAGGLTFTFLLE